MIWDVDDPLGQEETFKSTAAKVRTGLIEYTRESAASRTEASRLQ